VFSVRIESTDGANLATDPFVTAAVHGTRVNGTGGATQAIDLSAFTGQTVFVRFHWSVREDYTGPGFFQLDNVRLTKS
jgi:hypothetical protein